MMARKISELLKTGSKLAQTASEWCGQQLCMVKKVVQTQITYTIHNKPLNTR